MQEIIFEAVPMLRRLKTIALIINFQALFVAGLAVISTWFCIRYDFTANFPLTLLATAIVFPIVFSINSAYKRREVVLDDYGSLKSHGRAMLLAFEQIKHIYQYRTTC